MASSPLVSIVTCFYNEEQFLEETIKSVLRQTYTNWELLLVDDGSTDNSAAIARRYTREFSGKIFYIQHENYSNKGLSASRNAGIEKARGEFIAYLDADDVWLPEKLANQIKIFDANPKATVILEASRYWYSWHSKDRDDVTIPIGAEQDTIHEPPSLMLELYPLAKGAAPCPSGIMVRKSVHQKFLFEESFQGIYQMYEDQAFLSKIYMHEKIFVSSACNNLYRQRPSSLVSSVHASGKYNIVRRYYLEWFQNQLKQSGLKNSRIDQLLRNALMPFHDSLTFTVLHKIPSKIKDKTEKIFRRPGSS